MVHDVGQLEEADDPGAVGRRSEEVQYVELRLAEEDVGALLLENDDRAQQDSDRCGRHPAVVGEDRLALLGRQELEGRHEILEIEQRVVVVVAVLEDQRQDRGLGLVQVEHLAQQQRPERVDGRADLRTAFAAERQVFDRVASRLVQHAERRHPLLDARIGGIARDCQACEIALDVGHETGHAGQRQLAGHELKGLRLASSRGAGDQAMAVQDGKCHLHADARIELAIEHWAPQDQARLVERIARSQRRGKGFVHGDGG